MCANFTDDDEGKRVVNANGEEIGIVQMLARELPTSISALA